MVHAPIEGVKIDSIRSNMWDIYSQKGPINGENIILKIILKIIQVQYVPPGLPAGRKLRDAPPF